MSRPESLSSIKEKLDNPRNYGPLTRNAAGLLVTQCVDKRLVHVGGVARIAGNSLGVSTAGMMVRVEPLATSLREGMHVVDKGGLQRGVHTKVCAYDHNVRPVLGQLVDQKPRVMQVYEKVTDGIRQQLEDGNTKRYDGATVADRAYWANSHQLTEHTPDEVARHMSGTENVEVTVPPAPQVDRAAAFVIDTYLGNEALRGDVFAPGAVYLDSSAQVAHYAAEQSIELERMRPDMAAVAVSTAVLVAEAHDMPILVAHGAPGQREFIEF